MPLRPNPVRPTPWAYDGVPGEGSIPAPLPPPSSLSRPLIRLSNLIERDTRSQIAPQMMRPSIAIRLLERRSPMARLFARMTHRE